MKKLIKYACVVVFSIEAIAVSVLHSPTTAAAPVETVGPRALYLQNCSKCHGSDGRANTRLGKEVEAADLTTSDVQGKSVSSITRAIINGRPGMPAFRKKLRPTQISAIAGYVRTLGKN